MILSILAFIVTIQLSTTIIVQVVNNDDSVVVLWSKYWLYYIVNAIPLIVYPLIYVGIRSHYKRLISNN